MRHRHACACALREPTAQAGRIVELLRERLARTELPGPVRALRLRSGPLREANEEAGDLFARAQGRSTGVPQLVERLRARLGTDAVYGMQLVPEHRPEAAWEKGDILPGRAHSPFRSSLPMAGSGEGMPAFPSGGMSRCRPLWLLAEPQPLDGREHPRYEGRLEFEEARNASSPDGGTVVTCGATTTWRARPAACACGCFASDVRRAAGSCMACSAERDMGYAELHCLTNFSFLRGASHPEELVERAAELGYEALAITDECSVAGAVRAHVAAKASGPQDNHRQRVPSRRWPALRAAGHRQARLRATLPADHPGAARGAERAVSAGAARTWRV